MADTASIYVVVINDRHVETEIEVFTDRTEAIAWAQEKVHDYAGYPEDIEESLNDAMVESGWQYYASYSPEGDHAFVVEKELRP